MEVIPFEEELRALGVEVAHPHALLAVPLVAIVHTEKLLNEAEARRVLAFSEEHLALSTAQLHTVKGWLGDKPRWQFVDEALRALVLLRANATSVGFENSVYRHVLSEGQELVRERGDRKARERGEAVLRLLTDELQIDLGLPWEDIAPEELDSKAEHQQKDEEKRHEHPPHSPRTHQPSSR